MDAGRIVCVCGTVPFLKVVDPKRKEGKVDGDVLASRELESLQQLFDYICLRFRPSFLWGETRLFFG